MKKLIGIQTEGRRCNHCGKFQDWSNFYKNINSKTGYAQACKECTKQKATDYREKKKGELKIHINLQFKAPSIAKMNEEWKELKEANKELITTSNYSSFM